MELSTSVCCYLSCDSLFTSQLAEIPGPGQRVASFESCLVVYGSHRLGRGTVEGFCKNYYIFQRQALVLDAHLILQAYKQRVVEILLKFTGCVSVVRSNPNHNFSWLPCSPTNNEGTRRQTFQLLYRLSNTPSWSDVLDFVRSTILRLMESLLNVYSEHPPRNIYDICRVLSVSSPFSFMVFESQTS